MTLEEIEKLCEEATPGPWGYYDEDKEFLTYFTVTLTDSSGYIMQENNHEAKDQIFKNYRLAAASRTLLPKLLDVAKASLKIACKDPIEERHPSSTYTWDSLVVLQKALKELERE